MRRDALAFLAGITAIQFAPALPGGAGWWALALPPCAWLTWRSRFRFILFALLGLIYAAARAQQDLHHTLPASLEPLPVIARVQVDSLVQWQGPQARFDARVLGIDADVAVRRVRLSWMFAPRRLAAGQRWELPLTLKRPRGWRNPGAADTERLYLRAGIDALAQVGDRQPARLLGEATGGSTLLWLREHISAGLRREAAGSPSSGVLTGLAVGDTRDVTPELWALFRALGITHLMAISGSHVGLFGLLAAALVRRLWPLVRPRHGQSGVQAPCAVAAALASLGYALLAGFAVPSQRTAAMIALGGAARLRGRWLAPSHLLALALVLVLLIDPAAAVEPGFWLSFATVMWILASVPGAGWRAALGLQFGVSLLVLPLTLFAFGQASLIAPFVNLIAVPLTGFVLVPATLLAAALLFCAPALSHWLTAQLAASLDACWPVLMKLAAWPFAQYVVPSLPLPLAAAAIGGAALLTLSPAWPWRVIGASAVLSACSWRAPAPPAGGFEFTLLEAGDATLAVVLAPSTTLVYYAGSGSAFGADVGASVLLPFLRTRGRAQVDLLIISRADSAHAVGLESLLRELPVLQILGGGDPQAPCLAGQRFDRDGLRIRVLAPVTGEDPGPDASCVVRIAGAAGSVLLTGEITRRAEAGLVERGVPLAADVVVVPARGSHHASSSPFLTATRPRWALVAAAHLNRFGYPRPEVLARWQALGAQVRQVSLEGAITLRVPARGPIEAPPGERIRRRGFWTAT